MLRVGRGVGLGGAGAYLPSPGSSAPHLRGRGSCLGLRTGVSPHFSMNSIREILACDGYERGRRLPLSGRMANSQAGLGLTLCTA